MLVNAICISLMLISFSLLQFSINPYLAGGLRYMCGVRNRRHTRNKTKQFSDALYLFFLLQISLFHRTGHFLGHYV